MRVHDSVDLTTFEDVKITWPNSRIALGSSSSFFSLNNVNLHFPKGRLSIITGKTSSGKGLLLSAILGEADIEAEKSNSDFRSVATKQMKASTPSFAYVSQPPWVENRTIRENIIFGNEFDEDRYMAVLRACALERDLETLPHADMAMAGVNGGTLSGGQKWRISLARALYSQAWVLVLDDVLSAVDPHVAKWLCQHALSGPLVRGRTVIIATHHLATCVHLASYLVTVDSGTALGRAVTPRRNYGLLNIDIMPRSATSSPKPDPLAHSIDAHKKHPAVSRRPVLRTFTIYILGSGPWPVLLAVSTTLACRLLAAGNSWWLTKWTSNKELDEMSLRSSLYIYLALSVCAAVAVAVHAMAVQGVSQRASDSFQKEPTYVERMYDLLDVDMGLSWHITLGQRWIHSRYGILGSLFVCATAVSLVLAGANAATAGFTINVALQFKATMSGLMGKINLLTSGARAIDRVLDIAEAPTERQDGEDVAASWPASGRLEVKNVTVRYDADLPPVLRGTLRANLAIRGPRDDEELREALRKVAVQTADGRDAINVLDDLDMAVQAGGENLSHGQRQMVCLARAILNPRRIVILDEATSAVDRATDTMVQEVIRREFAESIMIIVAHRLATVADLDKIMVLDEGMAVEFGSPAELMQKKGIFWDMNLYKLPLFSFDFFAVLNASAQQDADAARNQKHMHSSGPRLKNGVDLQLQTAFYDQNWSTVVRLAEKRAKMVNDPYYEVLKVCAESQLDDPAAKYGAMTALLTYAKDGTVIKDADGIDLVEWATRDLLEEQDFPKTLGLLRVRAAKASPKDKSQTTRCLESCLLHWDLVSAQQISALIDKSFPQERAFLFWNIAITHLLAAEDKKALPSRSIQTEEEILLLYEIVGTHGTTADFTKLVDSAFFSPVEQLKHGRKEPLVYAIKKLQKDENWQSLFDICQACLSVSDDKGVPTLQASDWDVWRQFITAASRIQDCSAQATAAVQDLLLKLSKAANSKPMYKRNVMLARVSASFQLLESEHPDAIDSSPSSLRLRELVKYINNQASYPSCFDDIRLFAEQLDPSGIDYLAYHHFVSREPSDDLPELRRQILAVKLQYFAATCPQTCTTAGTTSERRACREPLFKKVYQASMALHKYISTISSYASQSTKDVQSEVALVAAFCLIGLANQLPSSLPTTEATQYLVQALLLLQQQLSSSPKHSQISLLLVQLHLRVGSAPEALAVWDTLAVKRTIMDSLAPLFYDRLSTVAPGMTSPLTGAGWQLMTSIKTHYQTSLKMRMPRRLIDAFQDGSYSSVLAVPRYIENLRVSCTRVMSLVESVRSERLFGVTDTDFFSDSRFTEVRDDTSMNEIIDYGSFPSWSHSATPAIYERLRLGPPPSAFQQTVAYTPPSFYKVPVAGSVADQGYVIESLGQIANSFSKFLPDAASSLNESELHYFQVVSLLSSLVPLCADRASGLHELVGQLASAVTASLDSQRDYLAALASGSGIGHAMSLLQSLHRVVLLRDTAVAVRNAAQWIIGFHEKQKERDRSGQSNLPKDVVAQTKALGAAADDALRQCRSWIMRLAQDTKSGGVVEREIKRFVYGGEEGRLLQGVVTDGTVFDLDTSSTRCTPGGIGHALALQFHAANYHVIATARRAEVLDELAAMGMSAVSLDVTSSASIEKCKAQVAEITGGTLDILLNNA
ncbi:hypothetical protein ARSEF1564_001337, partial [Beauveria bassiana]